MSRQTNLVLYDLEPYRCARSHGGCPSPGMAVGWKNTASSGL